MIHHISAVTFAARHMTRSVEFYQKLGFEPLFGNTRTPFGAGRQRSWAYTVKWCFCQYSKDSSRKISTYPQIELLNPFQTEDGQRVGLAHDSYSH